MGTSSSTLDVGKAIRSLLSNAPFTEEHISLLLSVSLSTTELDHAAPFTVLRCMRHYYTSNFARLIYEIMEVIAHQLEESTTGHGVKSDEARFHNALRLLRRLLPIAMEDGDTPCDEMETENSVPAENHAPNAANAQTEESNEKNEEAEVPDGSANSCPAHRSQNPEPRARTSFTKTFVQSFFVDGLACDDSQHERALPPLPGQQERPLGAFLCRLLLDCCFLRGFALPAGKAEGGTRSHTNASLPSAEETTHAHVDESLLWYPGIGSAVLPSSGKAVNAGVSVTVHNTRYELLTTITTLLSYPMFLPPLSRDRVFSEYLLNVECTPLLPQLVASALNAVLSYHPHGSIPYTSHWVGAEENVAVASLRFLCAALSAPGVPSEEKSKPAAPAADTSEVTDDSTSKDKHPTMRPKPLVIHSARKIIHDILPEEAHVILTRLQTMIRLKLYSYQTVLPDSQRKIQVQDELMMLLWRLVEFSPEFHAVFSREKVALKYLLPMVDYALDAQRDRYAFSHLQLILFLLLRLSENRSFCLLCNTSFNEHILFEFDSDVISYGDLLLLMLSRFLLIHWEIIRPMHGSCSAIISNLASFLTSISATASKKLILVFTSAAARCLSYAAAKHAEDATTRDTVSDREVVVDQAVMINIVEAMASVLQYHESGAAPLFKSLVTQRSLIEDVEKAFGPEAGKNVLSVQSPSPFLIRTLSAAVKNGDELNTLVGVLPTPHPIIVKKIYITPELDHWAFSTMWSFMYKHSPPGTFGDSVSIKLLRFS